MSEERTDKPRPDYFGQCAPNDASMNCRIEAASGLLCLADPEHLRQALFDAGLHVVMATDKAVLDAMAAVPRETLERSVANSLHAPEHSRAPCEAELARRRSRWFTARVS